MGLLKGEGRGGSPTRPGVPGSLCIRPPGCRKMVMAALGVTGELLARDGAGDREPLWALSKCFSLFDRQGSLGGLLAG